MLQAAVERCCTKKNVPKPQNFKLISRSNQPKLERVDPTHEGQIIACVVKPIVNSETPSMGLGVTCRQVVQSGPGRCPYHERHENIKMLDHEEFRKGFLKTWLEISFVKVF